MFPYLSALFLFTFLSQSCVSIKCIDKEVEWNTEKVLRDTTCEGNLCMNFLNGDQIDKTCITTGPFDIATGCLQYDDMNEDLIVCYCNTDLCNAGNATEFPSILTQAKCSNTMPGSTDITKTTAPMCSLRIVEQGTERTVTKAGEVDQEAAITIPVGRQAPLDFFTYTIGMVHTTIGIKKNLKTHDYKCYGDNCNDRVSMTHIPMKKNVVCSTNGTERCNGEFCVFATNGTVLKYCLSTHGIGGAKSYKAGIFKYKLSTFYLCNENHCNSDEETARLSITGKVPTTTVQPNNYGDKHYLIIYSITFAFTVLFH